MIGFILEEALKVLYIAIGFMAGFIYGLFVFVVDFPSWFDVAAVILGFIGLIFFIVFIGGKRESITTTKV